MISFLTFFLGLVSGTHAVEASVSAPVASVEFQIDGAIAARVAVPPWSAKVDFGKELAPHELVVRALDGAGRELGRARQWINLPRPTAEIEVVLERDETGHARSGRLAAESLLGGRPLSLSATLDGKTVAITRGGRFELPSYDERATHLFTVAAEFSGGVRSRRDLVLGGTASSVVSRQLTALPVKVSSGSKPPDPAETSDWFVEKGSPLSVVAVEHGAAQVFLVRDLSADEAISKLGRGGRSIIDASQLGAMPVYDPDALRREMSLGLEDRFQFVWPRARVITAANPPAELFETSHEFTARDGGFHWLLTRVEHPARAEAHPRYADAVAVAGLHALGSLQRRAVVLVLGKSGPDASRYGPAAVRRYLAKLRVPLFVWSLEKPKKDSAKSAWGETEDISSLPKLRAAFEKLRRELEEQWIIWLEGEHRPEEIALSSRAKDIDLVR